MEDKLNVVGFKIEAFSDRGKVAIKKNAKIPLLMRAIISSEVISENPFVVEVKLKPKLFKKAKGDSAKKLVVSSAENLIVSIKGEMLRSGCEQDLDFDVEVIRE